MRSKTPIFIILGLLALACLPGCSYVHFGRIDSSPSGENALVVENSDLKLEKKILQQELVIAHKEGDTLREALKVSNTKTIGDQTELAIRLREAAKELGTLRAQNARLQVERNQLKNSSGNIQGSFATSQEISDLKTQLSISEGKLTQTIADYTKFEQENSELRREVSMVRRDNEKLEEQVQSLTLQNEQAVVALSQLNTELLAQKAARQRAEDSARASQAQLAIVTAKTTPVSLAETRQGTAASSNELGATTGNSAQNAPTALTINIESETNAANAPTAVLRTSPDRLKNVAEQKAAAASEGGKRYHVVAEGETLASLAQKYYGKPNLWRLIYVANNSQLAGGRGLKPGMRLEIPRQ